LTTVKCERKTESMNGNESKSPFEIASDELRALGIRLRRLPGEYSVNFQGGGERSARLVETLTEALEIGRAMAAEAKKEEGTLKRPRRRRWRRKPITPEARYWAAVFRRNRRRRGGATRKRRRKP
jgi:hypothetical protein